MADIAKLGALAIVAAVFLYSLKKDWDGVYLIFGIILMLGRHDRVLDPVLSDRS